MPTPIGRSRDGTRLVFDVGDGYGRVLDADGTLYPPTLLAAIGKFGRWYDLDDFEPETDVDAAMARYEAAKVYPIGDTPADDPVIKSLDAPEPPQTDETDGSGDLVEYSADAP